MSFQGLILVTIQYLRYKEECYQFKYMQTTFASYFGTNIAYMCFIQAILKLIDVLFSHAFVMYCYIIFIIELTNYQYLLVQTNQIVCLYAQA